MREFHAGTFDVAVIGAGHAGIEAALAAARLGMETIIFTINLDAVGNMPCNPAIGGTGKGHLVRELDALGGEMAKAADECCIQYRLLNKGKGPAVWSLRAQADRRKYQGRMKRALERQERLTVRQGEVAALRPLEGGGFAAVLGHRGGVPCPGGDPGYGDLPRGPDHRGRVGGGLRSRRHARRREADGLALKTGPPPPPLQDRNAPPGTRGDGGF